MADNTNNPLSQININYGMKYQNGGYIKADEINHLISGILYNSELLDKNEQVAQNLVYAGPESNIGDNQTGFRKLLTADLKSIDSFFGALPMSRGGISDLDIMKSDLSGASQRVLGDPSMNVLRDTKQLLSKNNESFLIDAKTTIDALGKYAYYNFATDKNNGGTKDCKGHTVSIPLIGVDTISKVTLHFGTIDMEKKNAEVYIHFSENYNDANYYCLLSVGRENADGGGIDMLYNYIHSSSSIKIVKDYSLSRHKLKVFWFAAGIKK